MPGGEAVMGIEAVVGMADVVGMALMSCVSVIGVIAVVAPGLVLIGCDAVDIGVPMVPPDGVVP